jgi:hypothetical protein
LALGRNRGCRRRVEQLGHGRFLLPTYYFELLTSTVVVLALGVPLRRPLPFGTGIKTPPFRVIIIQD